MPVIRKRSVVRGKICRNVAVANCHLALTSNAAVTAARLAYFQGEDGIHWIVCSPSPNGT